MRTSEGKPYMPVLNTQHDRPMRTGAAKQLKSGTSYFLNKIGMRAHNKMGKCQMPQEVL